jgi:hypothetical protein
MRKLILMAAALLLAAPAAQARSMLYVANSQGDDDGDGLTFEDDGECIADCIE